MDDGWNCGAYALAYAEAYLKPRPDPRSLDAYHLRLRYFRFLTDSTVSAKTLCRKRRFVEMRPFSKRFRMSAQIAQCHRCRLMVPSGTCGLATRTWLRQPMESLLWRTMTRSLFQLENQRRVTTLSSFKSKAPEKTTDTFMVLDIKNH